MGERSAYNDPSINVFQYASAARPRASRPKRHSSITDPRSHATSSFDIRTALANSLKICIDVASTSAFCVGIVNSYTVSSMLVYAFEHAPNSAPIDSKKFTIAKCSYDSVHRNARCSTTCAAPRSPSPSNTDPASTASASAACSLGFWLSAT